MGWRVFYNKSAEMGWFTSGGRSPIESVFYSDFEEWVERMSVNRGIDSVA